MRLILQVYNHFSNKIHSKEIMHGHEKVLGLQRSVQIFEEKKILNLNPR